MKTSIELKNGQWSITVKNLTPDMLVGLINKNKLKVENKDNLADLWKNQINV